MATRFHPSSPAAYTAPGSANFDSPRKKLTQERTQSRGVDAPKRSAGIDVSDLLQDMSDSHHKSGPPSAGKPRGVSPTDYYNYQIERAQLFERVQQLEVQVHSLNAAYKESTMRRVHEENSFREISRQERDKADKTIAKLTGKVESREQLLIELVQAIAMLPSGTISEDTHLQTLCVKSALLIPTLRSSLVSIVDLDKLPKSLLAALGGSQKPQTTRIKTSKKKAKTKNKTKVTRTEPYDDFDRSAAGGGPQTPHAMETFTGDVFSTMNDTNHTDEHTDEEKLAIISRQTSLRRGSSTRYLTGQRVEANYRGRGVFFPATIRTRRSSDKTFDIDYDDGEAETFVKEEFIRPLVNNNNTLSDDMNSFIKSDNNSLNPSPDGSPKFTKKLNFASTTNTLANMDNQQQANKEDADRLLAELVASIDSSQLQMEEGQKLLTASELLALDESILSSHSDADSPKRKGSVSNSKKGGGDHLLSKEIREFIALAEEERDTDHLLTELIQAEANKISAAGNNTASAAATTGGSIKRKKSINSSNKVGSSFSSESDSAIQNAGLQLLTREESSLLNPDVEAYIQSLTFLGGGSNDEQLDAALQDLIDGTSDSVDSDPFALSNDILAATKRRLTQQLAGNNGTNITPTVDTSRPSQSLRQASNVLPALDEEEEGELSWEDADDEENSFNTPNHTTAIDGRKKKKKKGSKKKKAKSASTTDSNNTDAAKPSKRMSADAATVSNGGAKSILSAAAAAVKAVVDGGNSMLSGTSSKSNKKSSTKGAAAVSNEGSVGEGGGGGGGKTTASGKYWWDMSAEQTQQPNEQAAAATTESKKSTKTNADKLMEDSYVEKLKLGGDLDLDPSLTF